MKITCYMSRWIANQCGRMAITHFSHSSQSIGLHMHCQMHKDLQQEKDVSKQDAGRGMMRGAKDAASIIIS